MKISLTSSIRFDEMTPEQFQHLLKLADEKRIPILKSGVYGPDHYAVLACNEATARHLKSVIDE